MTEYEQNLAPVERLAMALTANSLFLQQGFPTPVLVSEWRKLRHCLDEVLDLDLDPTKTIVITDPLPEDLLRVMSESHKIPDDLSTYDPDDYDEEES